ncbi:MAG: transposase [Spirochaetes bacterium]|nr:transposase [Spirochaetota bacterium]
MSRKLRICLPNITYHITSRCIEKRPLMKTKKMKELMLEVLTLSEKKYTYQLNGYTLMDDHFHFYIKTIQDQENISRIMQFIKSQYARRYNRIMNRTGPFWNERFNDSITEKAKNPRDAFLNNILYIGYNPVPNHQAQDPRDYVYSSFRCYVDEDYKSPVKIILHDYFLNLGTTFKERANKLIEYEDLYRKRIFPASLFA